MAPFYHDMGLIMGVCAPLAAGRSRGADEPLGIPAQARELDAASGHHPDSVSAAPNFAFDLAVRRTSDADMFGLDLGEVQAILSGAERVHYSRSSGSPTVCPFGLQERVLGPPTAWPRRPSTWPRPNPAAPHDGPLRSRATFGRARPALCRGATAPPSW